MGEEEETQENIIKQKKKTINKHNLKEKRCKMIIWEFYNECSKQYHNGEKNTKSVRCVYNQEKNIKTLKLNRR